ncbi:hypothetical protein C7212DRAFT_62063, partial [Tuber magnatum]
WYEHMQEWGHLVLSGMVKSMVEAIISLRVNGSTLEKNWVTQFVNRHSTLTTKLGTG